MMRAKLALPAIALICFVAGAGIGKTIAHVEDISYEHAVYILDTEPGDSQRTRMAQSRLKALVSVGLATLARQAVSGDELGADALRFLLVVRQQLQELPR